MVKLQGCFFQLDFLSILQEILITKIHSFLHVITILQVMFHLATMHYDQNYWKGKEHILKRCLNQ
ncbi:hypothetical protein MA16_Dca010791 [Dendrobium catenatum]|uniref:Uncharacterized protein n=1 Tax=Dendrobium catenatum TaxID=906689 RepID=A0A2I0W581_9ASPA|nr:hypothetical protein MA16_Dca010791 [Dendrobium catenatum]